MRLRRPHAQAASAERRREQVSTRSQTRGRGEGRGRQRRFRTCGRTLAVRSEGNVLRPETATYSRTEGEIRAAGEGRVAEHGPDLVAGRE
eukprot:427477-Hanusia_phi.AAC.1